MKAQYLYAEDECSLPGKMLWKLNNLLVFSALKDYISFNFIWLGLSIKNQEKRYFEVSLLIQQFRLICFDDDYLFTISLK